MGLLELSKFKLQLRSLITEVRDLRERERLATEQLHHQIQKQKQTEEEHGRKLQELQTEFAMSNEQRQKLERQVSYLQNDNTLLENKQKELKGTIQSLLQSREVFINAYEESTYELKRSVECRDRKLTVLSEKIRSHLLLFDSIEKEAFSIKQVINDVQCLVNEKEEVVAALKSKMDKVLAFEKVFVEKISDLQNKRKNDKDELRRKDRIISELDAHLEAARTSNNHQNQIQELQKTLSAKDVVIQNLISEKEALHIELGTVSIILQKIQDVVTNMHEEDKREFSLILKWQEGCDTVMKTEDNGTENLPQSKIEKFPDKVSDTGKENTASLLSEEYKKVGGPLQDQNTNGSCMSESTCSELQLAASIRSVSFDDGKDNCTSSVHHSDSESSTTQAETSGDPGAQV
ncbi:myosin-7 isoform X1 [Juglans microcarpa x Juglans regia]|uniref:myosin-7 isoform X1 n=1 Tax=Juglans microcarpa x Juglans regia TaxID=2249226 RepID=UPI001B7D959A|nr:myosin-7 isoform X1 [Juglans microcarpa x Juglans regia]XP_041013696.1 myosin-7 isoform X1 [Juglans microcarpa x Juglans regia]XP_041013697.1 myosin-7 isoform X1 [Juglans microcarpa x Juglans regia]